MAKFFKKLAKKNDGFTLVELIVVIAILGILAAVAVPAYSGYMDKAKEAADTQVTSAINTAFAAACTENGESNTDVTANVNVNSTSFKVEGITVTAGVSETVGNNIEADFLTYFAGNTDTVLEYYGSFTQGTDGNFTGVKR